ASPARYSANNSEFSDFITNPRIQPNPPPHLRSRAMQVRLQLRDRMTRDLRNLFVTALMQHLQREHQSLVFVKRRKRTSDHVVQLFIQHALDRRRSAVTKIEHCSVREMKVITRAHTGSQSLTRNVSRNAKQPRRKLRLAPHRAYRAKRAHERFLCQLFREGAIVNHVEDETDNRAGISFKDQTKGFSVTRAHARNQV